MSKRSGKYEDMGDVLIHTEWLFKGPNWRLHPSEGWIRLAFHVGLHLDVLPGERPSPTEPSYTATPERIDLTMDLAADKQVELTVTFKDEMDNDVPAPEGTVYSWLVDNTTVIGLTSTDAAATTAAATGVTGNAVVSLTVTLPSGRVITGDLLISVVPGEAERLAIVPGAVTEVTPDVP